MGLDYFQMAYDPTARDRINKEVLFDFSEAARRLFWTQPRESLTVAATGRMRSPMDALRDGDTDKVWRCAQGYAER